jgi:proteasome lid subunit RPN8/RPN11
MNQDEMTYTALITITLPETATKASANITLTPPDTVEANGRILHLRDCTLADLQAFADQLEAEVWLTYQEIKLIDLAEQAEIEVTVLDEAGQPMLPLQNWPKQKVILPQLAAEGAAVEAEIETDEVETPVLSTSALLSVDCVEVAAPAEIPTAEEPIIEPEPEPEPAVEEEELELTVSEPEPVFPELEVSEEDLAVQAVEPRAYPTPAIAPSEARVRIAGQRLPIGDFTWTAVDILIDEPALRAAQAHALGSLNREVAGVLVGPRPEKQPDGRYVVHIIDTIIAKHTVMHGASVTYTPESWRYLNDKLAERYPDETAVMVGWYHTHPGFGIFLSGMDLFIHQNFFTQIWHTALVLDPVAKRSGFFCWDRQKTRVSPVDFAWPSWAAGSW